MHPTDGPLSLLLNALTLANGHSQVTRDTLTFNDTDILSMGIDLRNPDPTELANIQAPNARNEISDIVTIPRSLYYTILSHENKLSILTNVFGLRLLQSLFPLSKEAYQLLEQSQMIA
ncbi:hypothetical protein BZG36_00351 [Bifiguratus adelaidae]|uniref:Uncharacterized protein n=1 Tax=Bifiguratus adelaidae TaxID=1938954 RepID=A0A261Y851_9FUNG|nr:hypothetical protein BZG36_00351 [Bifiguratus adelaidae]